MRGELLTIETMVQKWSYFKGADNSLYKCITQLKWTPKRTEIYINQHRQNHQLFQLQLLPQLFFFRQSITEQIVVFRWVISGWDNIERKIE